MGLCWRPTMSTRNPTRLPEARPSTPALPRLTDAERDTLQDDYSVTPAAMDDAQIARRDLSTMERLYVAQAESTISEADQALLIEIIDTHRHYRALWMQSARNTPNRQVRHDCVMRARQCGRLVLMARRRLRRLSTQSLALTCAQRLSHFTRHQFDPQSPESWQTVDRLWRAARMAMDTQRGAQA